MAVQTKHVSDVSEQEIGSDTSVRMNWQSASGRGLILNAI